MPEYIEPMKPIIEIVTGQMRTSLEGELYRAVQNVGINVDKDRLLQALNDARSFYDEGYRAGQKAADMVAVVRCQYCPYFADARVNEKGFLICPASGMEITGMDYCSYGERRGEDD